MNYEHTLQQLIEQYEIVPEEKKRILQCQIRAMEIAIEKRDKRIVKVNNQPTST